jgi:predicted MFS family arabinose efflux permease
VPGLIDVAVIGVILASFQSLISGFKMSFLIISFVAVILAITSIFLKSRKEEVASMKKKD